MRNKKMYFYCFLLLSSQSLGSDVLPVRSRVLLMIERRVFVASQSETFPVLPSFQIWRRKTAEDIGCIILDQPNTAHPEQLIMLNLNCNKLKEGKKKIYHQVQSISENGVFFEEILGDALRTWSSSAVLLSRPDEDELEKKWGRHSSRQMLAARLLGCDRVLLFRSWSVVKEYHSEACLNEKPFINCLMNLQYVAVEDFFQPYSKWCVCNLQKVVTLEIFMNFQQKLTVQMSKNTVPKHTDLSLLSGKTCSYFEIIF